MARKPLLIWDTIPASDASNIAAGTRVVINWDGLDRQTVSDALAIQTISGWTVRQDYRCDGSDTLLLEGKDYRGEMRYLPVAIATVRVEIGK